MTKQKGTISILESIRNKMKKIDKRNPQTSKEEGSDSDFDYIDSSSKNIIDAKTKIKSTNISQDTVNTNDDFDFLNVESDKAETLGISVNQKSDLDDLEEDKEIDLDDLEEDKKDDSSMFEDGKEEDSDNGLNDLEEDKEIDLDDLEEDKKDDSSVFEEEDTEEDSDNGLDDLEEEDEDDKISPLTQQEQRQQMSKNMDNNGLLSEDSIKKASNSIKQLINTIPKPQHFLSSQSTAFKSGETIEDMVAGILAPKLEQWLNENLPIMVERIVKEEIKKLIPKD